MNENDPVGDIVSMVDNEIMKAEERVSRLRAARRALGASEEYSVIDTGTPSMIVPTVSGMSIPDACETLLRHFQKPQKARALAEAMLSGGYEYNRGASKLRASLTGSMHRLLGKGVFTKPEPGTYGLVEWERTGPSGNERSRTGAEQRATANLGLDNRRTSNTRPDGTQANGKREASLRPLPALL